MTGWLPGFSMHSFVYTDKFSTHTQNHSDKLAVRLTIAAILASEFFFHRLIAFCFYLSSAFIQIDEAAICLYTRSCTFSLIWLSFVWWPDVVHHIAMFVVKQPNIYTVPMNYHWVIDTLIDMVRHETGNKHTLFIGISLWMFTNR